MNNEDFITLGESTNVLRLGIRTKEGKDTGEQLIFNLKDIELLDRLDRMWNESKRNYQWINNQITIINKKQDFKKKDQWMSNNEKSKYEAIKSFYKKQKDIYDLFLGEGGTDKLLYGRPIEWETLEEINKIISEQISPKLNINMKNIEDEIKSKYKVDLKNKGNVLKEDE